jgi:hypothetical protein
MNNYKITAHLTSNVSLTDDWSPSLPSILERLWFDENTNHEADPDQAKLRHPDISIDKVELFQDLVRGVCIDWYASSLEVVGVRLDSELPKNWMYACSAPTYKIANKQIANMRRVGSIDSTRSVSSITGSYRTDTGVHKAYDKPVQVLTLADNQISWFCQSASSAKLLAALEKCYSIGARRAAGCGQVKKWTMEEIDTDYSLIGVNKELMAPVPERLMPLALKSFHPLRSWAWRPCPVEQMAARRELCAMPQLVSRG